MTNNRAPWLACLVLGCLAVACSGGASATPGGPTLQPPTDTPSAAVSPTPSPLSGSSQAARPAFSEAQVPKVAAGVPPENVPVVFEETGVPGQTISYTLTADGMASYHCWNPQTQEIDTQKETVSRTVTATATLTSDASGRVRGTLQLAPPRPEKLACLLGYRAVPYAGTYNRVVLADTTNHLSVELGDHEFVGG